MFDCYNKYTNDSFGEEPVESALLWTEKSQKLTMKGVPLSVPDTIST